LFREARALGLVDESGRWHDDDIFEIKRLARTEAPVPVCELIGDVPADLDVLLRRWLAIDPAMRNTGMPGTMADRVCGEFGAIFTRVRDSGAAVRPVGFRVAQEPDLAGLRRRWMTTRATGGDGWPGGNGRTSEPTHFHEPTTVVPLGPETSPGDGDEAP
jgi:hypothetical protein